MDTLSQETKDNQLVMESKHRKKVPRRSPNQRLQQKINELEVKHNALVQLVAPLVDVTRQCVVAFTVLQEKGLIDNESIKTAQEKLLKTAGVGNIGDKVSEHMQIQSDKGANDEGVVGNSDTGIHGDTGDDAAGRVEFIEDATSSLPTERVPETDSKINPTVDDSSD